MDKLVNFNLNTALTIGVLAFGCLAATDSQARGLYKSVNADGKITYSNFPIAKSQSTQNISSLKNSPKFSISNNTSFRAFRRS